MANVEPRSATRPLVGLLDTSIFIAWETGRPLNGDVLPRESAVSIVTIGELQLGVLSASRDKLPKRLETLNSAFQLHPTPVDGRVANAWALLRQRLKTAGIRMEANDSWIAATAMAHGWSVVTQDAGFPEGIEGLTVVRA
jgi:hypothetical protein